MNPARSEKILAVLSRLEVLIFVGFSFFIIPLSIYPGIVDPGMSVRFLLLASLIALLSMLRLIRAMVGRRPFPEVPAFVALWCAGYCLVCMVSTIQALNTSEAVVETAKVFLLCGFIWYASSVIRRSRHHVHRFAGAVSASALIISILGIFEYWGVMSLIETGNTGPGATMINRNLLSSFLFLCLPFVLFSTFLDRHPLRRFLGSLSYASILYLFLATQTRAVWLGCAGGFMCALGLTLAANPSRLPLFFRMHKRNIVGYAVLSCIIFVAGSVGRPQRLDQPSITRRAATIFDLRFKSNHQRIVLWQKTLHMVHDHPFLGVGPGNWKIHLPRYGTGDLVFPDMDVIEIRPYNDFLWVLSETGALGFILYCGLFVIAGLSCVRSIRSARSPETVFIAFLLLFALSGFAIISLFDFPKERIEHLVLFGMILSVCSSINRPAIKPLRCVRRQNKAVPWVFMAGACVCLWIGFLRVKGDAYGAAMRAYWHRAHWNNAIAAADTGLRR